MKRIAIFCVTFNSDKELEQYQTSLKKAAEKAAGQVTLDIFVARNTKEDNPGYFGGIKREMDKVDVTAYDYCILSNVDLTVEKDFFEKLAAYDCSENTGWIAPQIWSELEGRDRNPGRVCRPSLRRMRLLKMLYRHPKLEKLYSRTLYRRKKYQAHKAGPIYAGHGSIIILTRKFMEACGKIDYPVFLFCEEIYLAEQCRKAGLSVMYVPDIKVSDTEHASTGQMNHGFYCRCNYQAMQYIIKEYY